MVVGGGIDLEIIILLTLLGVLPLLSKLIFNRLFNTNIPQ